MPDMAPRMGPDMTKILILGGTTEARALAEALSGREDLAVTVSLAGRTTSPVPHPVPVRTGGFGGAEGLARHLAAEQVALLVDATHPFAARISRHATVACQATGVPIIRLVRPEWIAGEGDRWTAVADGAAAVAALGEARRCVFLALGRQEIAPFATAPQHRYVIRSIEPVGEVPFADAVFIRARGPFDVAAEEALFREHAVEVVVAKNSGGGASDAKLAAARRLGLPVVMIERPPPEGEAVADVASALAAIDRALGRATAGRP